MATAPKKTPAPKRKAPKKIVTNKTAEQLLKSLPLPTQVMEIDGDWKWYCDNDCIFSLDSKAIDHAVSRWTETVINGQKVKWPHCPVCNMKLELLYEGMGEPMELAESEPGKEE